MLTVCANAKYPIPDLSTSSYHKNTLLFSKKCNFNEDQVYLDSKTFK